MAVEGPAFFEAGHVNRFQRAKRERRRLRRLAKRRRMRGCAGAFGGHRGASSIALGMRELGRGIAAESVAVASREWEPVANRPPGQWVNLAATPEVAAVFIKAFLDSTSEMG